MLPPKLVAMSPPKEVLLKVKADHRGELYFAEIAEQLTASPLQPGAEAHLALRAVAM